MNTLALKGRLVPSLSLACLPDDLCRYKWKGLAP